jgi:hypothetical protein
MPMPPPLPVPPSCPKFDSADGPVPLNEVAGVPTELFCPAYPQTVRLDADVGVYAGSGHVAE